MEKLRLELIAGLISAMEANIKGNERKVQENREKIAEMVKENDGMIEGMSALRALIIEVNQKLGQEPF